MLAASSLIASCGRVGFEPLSSLSGNASDASAADATDVDAATPGFANIQIAGGWLHTCASIDGRVACWGLGASGQLGRGDNLSSAVPRTVALPGPATAITAGRDHSCAVSLGDAYCWGSGADGRLGSGDLLDRLEPNLVEGLPIGGVTAIGAARFSTCAVANGEVYCWGRNSGGQLGINEMQGASTVPVLAQGLASGVDALALAADRACAVRDRKGYCWGHDHSGDLGTAGNGGSTIEEVVVVPTLDALGIGLQHACGVLDGAVSCWGRGVSGELGDGMLQSSTTAVQVSGLESGVTSMSVGGGIVEAAEIDSSCAVQDGNVLCWGRNDYGQLGSGDTAVLATPATVQGLAAPARLVEVGGGHACAVLEPNTIACWGRGTDGQLGHDFFADSFAPVVVQSW